MFRILAVGVLGLYLSPQFLFAQEPPQPHPVKVHVSVSGPDILKASIRANVIRELEARGNMTVTAADPHWILQIVALEMECPPGTKGTIVVSVLILETFPNAPLRVFLSDKLDGPTVSAIGRLTSGLFRFSRNWMETAPASDPGGLTESIVSRFRSVIQNQEDRKGKKSTAEE